MANEITSYSQINADYHKLGHICNLKMYTCIPIAIYNHSYLKVGPISHTMPHTIK